MEKENKEVECLYKAVEWGLGTNRPAWKRALSKALQNADSWPSELLVSVREEVLTQSGRLISDWYGEVISLGGDVGEILTFDDNPEGLWQELYYMNYGVFGLGPDPLDGFLISVPSRKSGEMPLLLSPKADGWGV